MADNSSIEWTDATWNPITGCSVVSPGCTNCYAMRLAGTRLQHHPSRAGLTRDSKAGPAWTGEVRFNEQWLDQPLRWKRPRRVFTCAHGDLFHESVPDEWIDQVFAVMALAPQHTFQVLTKRAKRMRSYMTGGGALPWLRARISDAAFKTNGVGSAFRAKEAPWPLPNVWLGVSAEDQQRADQRIPDLLATPAAVRWVSAEPLLGQIALGQIDPSEGDTRRINATTGEVWYPGCGSVSSQTLSGPRIDWVVAGGESGPGARPMHPTWARSLRDQCAAGGVPFHFKQWGEHLTVYDRDADDPDWRRCDTIRHQTPDGRWLNLAGGHGFHGDNVVRVDRVGKTKAGRLLDGREHNEAPRG